MRHYRDPSPSLHSYTSDQISLTCRSDRTVRPGIVSVQTARVEADRVNIPGGVLHKVPDVPELLRLDVGEKTVADVRLT